MDENPTETPTPAQVELRAIEGSLKSLWERARRAATVISELRAENRDLRVHGEQLESEVGRLREELTRKEQLIKRMSVEAGSVGASKSAIVTNGEREALVARVKDLLVKLEAYL